VGDAVNKAIANKEEKGNVCNTNITKGGTVDYTLRRLARDAPELLDKIEVGELPKNGSVGNGRSKNSFDNVKPNQGGTSVEYLLAKLKRDAWRCFGRR